MTKYLTILLSLIFIACSSDDSNENESESITVEVTELNYNTVTISWNSISGNDQILYNIYLNESLIEELVSDTNYSFVDLSENTLYSGKIEAIEGSVVIGFSNFEFITTENENTSPWLSINSGTSSDLDAIHFFDTQKGICSGGFVNILNTINSGNSWNISSSLGYRDFDFYSRDIGYAASRVGNSIGRTIDGGETWTSLTPPTSNSLWGVAATSSSTVYFVGTGGVLWKTTNSGISFTVLDSGVSDLLTDIVFTNSTTGFILSQISGIRKTTDAGASWTTIYTPNGIMTEMHFVNESVGYAIGSDGLVVKTTDAGSTWSILPTNSTSYLQGVHFFDINNGIVVGTGGTILITKDGGTNWDQQNSNTTEILNDARMLSENSAIVIGDNGVILKNENI